MINIVQSKTVIGQCSLMHYQTIRLVGVAAMLTPANAWPWLVTRFCKKHAFSNTGNKVSEIQFLITHKRPYTNSYVRKRSAQLDFCNLYHGKRKPDRAAMVSDCIDPPWLRALEGPRPTFVSHREPWGRHRIRVKIRIGTMLCLEKRYTYTCMHLYPIYFPRIVHRPITSTYVVIGLWYRRQSD